MLPYKGASHSAPNTAYIDANLGSLSISYMDTSQTDYNAVCIDACS
jgi:hypothetical protein